MKLVAGKLPTLNRASRKMKTINKYRETEEKKEKIFFFVS